MCGTLLLAKLGATRTAAEIISMHGCATRTEWLEHSSLHGVQGASMDDCRTVACARTCLSRPGMRSAAPGPPCWLAAQPLPRAGQPGDQGVKH